MLGANRPNSGEGSAARHGAGEPRRDAHADDDAAPSGETATQPVEAADDLPPLPGGRSPSERIESGGPGLSQRKIADAYSVPPMSVSRAERVRQAAPDLQAPMRTGVINLHDAMRIQHEPEEVRRQAVQDVRDGKATTAVAAIRDRYHRDPAAGPNGGSGTHRRQSDVDPAQQCGGQPPRAGACSLSRQQPGCRRSRLPARGRGLHRRRHGGRS